MSELKTATIAASGNLSAAVDLTVGYIVDVLMPAAWTAAALTFQICETEDGTYRDVQTESAELSITAAAGDCVKLDPDRLLGDCWLKLRSGTSAAPVSQAAERAIGLKIRRLP